MADPRRVAVLVSGRGSNLRALVEQADGYEVVLVASNRPGAAALDWARGHGLPTWCWDSRGVAREAFDAELSAALEAHGAGTVALAGYMRLLSAEFIARWRGAAVNIHPSLLPRHKGLDPHARVIAEGDSTSGCTVHLVSEEMDSGAILAQAEIAVAPGESAEGLAQRVLALEHATYPRALAEFIRQRVERD